MKRQRTALPLRCRTEARLLLHDQLIAALTRQPLDLTRDYLDRWLDALADVAHHHGPVIGDLFVVGEPCPELLEIAHELRCVRCAERRGDFDHEEDEWYEVHSDDDDPWVPPPPHDRVVTALAERRGFGPVSTHLEVMRLVAGQMQPTRDQIADLVQIALCAEQLLGEVSEVARLDDLVVVDGRPDLVRRRGWAWAA